MDEEISQLIDRLRNIEDQIENKFERRRKEFQLKIENQKIIFTKEILYRQKMLRKGIIEYVRSSNPIQIICMPFVYGLIVPLVFLDVSVTIYQRVCFTIWKLPLVQRSRYVIFDHHHLAYINGIQKANCLYCSYANGVIALAREVASQTEQYWCPIKHATRMHGSHDRYRNFLEYGDADGFHRKSEEYREKLKTVSQPSL